MEIIVGEKSGFCYGVRNAVEKSEESVDKFEKVYCLGEIVHNENIVSTLEQKGMITVHNIEDVPNGEKVIFRAHGISKEIYEIAKERNIDIIDLTCPSVLALHKKTEDYSKDGAVIILGEKEHPESVATKTFAEECIIIENENDIEEIRDFFKNSKFNKAYIIAQTTFSMEKFDIISNKIKELYTEKEIIVDKTICNATKLRQDETEKIAKEVEFMIIVGGKKSANTRKLYDISLENCDNAILVQTKDDINFEEVQKFNKIGIMAGASTPEKIVKEIIECLK